MVVHDIVLFLHFLGLMIGSAGGMASGIIMRRTLTMTPEEARPVRSLGPLLSKVALVGVAVLWVTGVIMVATTWGVGSLPSMFWVKMVFVVLLTGFAIFIEMTYREIRAGNIGAAARLPKIGPLSGLSALLAVFFAVLTFH